MEYDIRKFFRSIDSKKIIIAFILVVLSVFLMLVLTTESLDNNNEVKENFTKSTSGYEVIKKHSNPKEYTIHTNIIIESKKSEDFFEYTTTIKNEDKLLTYKENVNRGETLIYNNLNNDRYYINMKFINLNFYDNTSKINYLKLNGGIKRLNKIALKNNSDFEKEDLKNLELSRNSVKTLEETDLIEYTTKEYEGEKYEDLSLNLIIDKNGRVRFLHLKITTSEYTYNMAIEYTNINNTKTINEPLWIENSISRQEAIEKTNRSLSRLDR